MPYLFVHFREKLTIDGEQVHFAISENGTDWERVNGGKPVLTCTTGELGCRDIELVRLHTGGFVLVATDACIVRYMDDQYRVDWRKLNHEGSKFLSLWRSDDLLHFSPQELLFLGRDDFGCLWAPEVFFDEDTQTYLLHWSATVRETAFEHMSIYACETKDFKTFTRPKLFFDRPTEILDSHLVKHGDTYHLFYKNSNHPSGVMHATSKSLYGPYADDGDFTAIMQAMAQPGSYEAPTTLVLPDGRWCLMLDFFGCEKEKMGYVPFVSPAASNAAFERADAQFTFPYGFKHGHAVEITPSEYEALRRFSSEN